MSHSGISSPDEFLVSSSTSSSSSNATTTTMMITHMCVVIVAVCEQKWLCTTWANPATDNY